MNYELLLVIGHYKLSKIPDFFKKSGIYLCTSEITPTAIAVPRQVRTFFSVPCSLFPQVKAPPQLEPHPAVQP